MDTGLYIVATPIGNLGDITARAVEVLEQVDLIAAEDTRHSQRLLQHFAIDTRLVAYHDHSDARSQERIASVLAEGGSVALISDAGTPLISDPGYRLVREMQSRGYAVHPVPGPCAAVAALSVCGLPTDRFRFEGFLPAKPGARNGRLVELSAETATMVFYEAPHRIVDTLAAMTAAWGGDREAVLAREITKTFETIRRDSLDGLQAFVEADTNQRKGEIVLVVSGRSISESALDADTARLLRRLAEELPAKRAAALVAEHSGLRKNTLYQYLLSVKED
ncbi:16S rRNA (cytidine(1402)-2'-O)-methyltransferase [Pseudohalioglobus sediminis]|uniref:Ribosomal RNA small subunit methyltransferase I n=1 Tax=Pseudohalioglobus sediminis TaxID=2606449 RepID=A0A5B0X7C7_9GAMM|nr:16S rRNA (cytidine(1402)-2'-O)-methyltransferase [Pseudohalioglobus sediminis]KAA1194498.1 16S rRNA (cytidine(1402)-2'-O)-methyltransferase [Pseudohalioglobus sediminis]